MKTFLLFTPIIGWFYGLWLIRTNVKFFEYERPILNEALFILAGMIQGFSILCLIFAIF